MRGAELLNAAETTLVPPPSFVFLKFLSFGLPSRRTLLGQGWVVHGPSGF